MTRPLLALGILLSASLPASAQTRPDLPLALRKAIESGPRLRYVGKRRVEIRRDGKTESFTELVTRDGSRLRIEFPAGSSYTGQIIVEDQKERRHFFPDKNEIHVSPARRDEAFERLVRLARGTRYKFSVGAEETVAGIAADQVVVSDPNGNVLQRLFIDPRSGLLLKRKVYDPVGTQVGFFEFKTIDLSPTLPGNLFQITRRGARIVQPTDLARKIAADAGFVFAYVKPTSGFRLAFTKVNTFDGKDVLMQFYSSSQGRLSLFQTKADVSQAQLDKFSRGDLKVHSWKAKGKTFVLIGNLEQTALKQLATQVAFK